MSSSSPKANNTSAIASSSSPIQQNANVKSRTSVSSTLWFANAPSSHAASDLETSQFTVSTDPSAATSTSLPQTQAGAAITSSLDAVPADETPILVIVTSEVYLVLETLTSTSSGVTLHSTSGSWVTSVGSTTVLPSSQERTTQTGLHASKTSAILLSTKTGVGLPPPSKHGMTGMQILAGCLGGLGGALIAGILIGILLWWHRMRHAREVRAAQHDDDPRLQGIDAHRAGELLQYQGYETPAGSKTSLEVNRSYSTLPAAAVAAIARNETAAKRARFSPSRKSYLPISPPPTSTTPPNSRVTTLSAMAAAQQARMLSVPELEGSKPHNGVSGLSIAKDFAEPSEQMEKIVIDSENSVSAHDQTPRCQLPAGSIPPPLPQDDEISPLSPTGPNKNLAGHRPNEDGEHGPNAEDEGYRPDTEDGGHSPDTEDSGQKQDCLIQGCLMDHATSWSSLDGQSGPVR